MSSIHSSHVSAARGARRLLLGLTVAIATVLAGLTGGTAWAQTTFSHEVEVIDGARIELRLSSGADRAGDQASVVILTADADPAAPTDGQIAFLDQVELDDQGGATVTLVLPQADLTRYQLAVASSAGGERYIAPLVDGGPSSPAPSTPAPGSPDPSEPGTPSSPDPSQPGTPDPSSPGDSAAPTQDPSVAPTGTPSDPGDGTDGPGYDGDQGHQPGLPDTGGGAVALLGLLAVAGGVAVAVRRRSN